MYNNIKGRYGHMRYWSEARRAKQREARRELRIGVVAIILFLILLGIAGSAEFASLYK